MISFSLSFSISSFVLYAVLGLTGLWVAAKIIYLFLFKKDFMKLTGGEK